MDSGLGHLTYNEWINCCSTGQKTEDSRNLYKFGHNLVRKVVGTLSRVIKVYHRPMTKTPEDSGYDKSGSSLPEKRETFSSFENGAGDVAASKVFFSRKM